MPESQIGVLIVEHLPQTQKHLLRILESDSRIRVLGMVANSQEALKFIERRKPDLITVDIALPGRDGLFLTQELMEKNPIPIVAVGSAAESIETTLAFDMLEAGALAAVEKPGSDHDDFGDAERNLIDTVKTMAEVKLVRRRKPRSGDGRNNDGKREQSAISNSLSAPILSEAGRGAIVDLVAIGASTGGPGVIQLILKSLPADFPAPIVIAQHIAPGFTDALVHWLATTTGFKVKICGHNDKLEPSTAYLCPEGFQTGLSSSLRVKLAEDGQIHGVRPSVSYLFSSLAEVSGRQVVAILLTGMGRDGAEELKVLRDRGGITIVQDAESSLVHGMPGEAIKLGAAQHVLPAQKIPELLVELACRRR